MAEFSCKRDSGSILLKLKSRPFFNYIVKYARETVCSLVRALGLLCASLAPMVISLCFRNPHLPWALFYFYPRHLEELPNNSAFWQHLLYTGKENALVELT